MGKQWAPLAVRHFMRALGVTDRELELLIAERRALDEGVHAYPCEHDLERT